MEFTGLRLPLGRKFVPDGFLQVTTRLPAAAVPAGCLPACHASVCASKQEQRCPAAPALTITPLAMLPLQQAAEAPAEEGGLGSRYSFRQRFYSTLPPTLDNQLRVNLGLGMPQGICFWVLYVYATSFHPCASHCLTLAVPPLPGLPRSDAIIADKAFNTKETTNAFLGYPAVESVEYDPR